MAFRGSGWAALGAGLANLGALAERSQQQARRDQIADAERDLRTRTIRAQEMSVPGAMSLEAALPALNERAAQSGDPNATALTPESLARIGNAGDTGATIDFQPPAPITRKGANGQSITVRDNAPFLTGTGVVEDPRGAREQAQGQSDLAYATTTDRAQAEADRQGDLLEKAGVPKDRVAAIRARVPAGSVDDLFRQDSRALTERMPISIQMKQARVNNLRERAELRRRGIKPPDRLSTPEVKAEYERQLDLARQDDEALGGAIDDLSQAQDAWMAANPRGGVTPLSPNDDGSGQVGMPTSPASKPFVYARPGGSYALPQDLTGGQDINTSLPQPALGNISAMVNRGKVSPPSTPTPTLAPPLAALAPDTSSAGSAQMASANAADTSSVGPTAPLAPPVPAPAPPPAAAPAAVTAPTSTLDTNDPATAKSVARKLQAQGKTPAEIMQIMNEQGFKVKHRGQS